MISEKIAAAKRARTAGWLKTGFILAIILITMLAVLVWISLPKNDENEKAVNEAAVPLITTDEITTATLDDSTLRERYLANFAHLKNNLKPALTNIDMAQWNTSLNDWFKETESTAIKQFGQGDYASANQSLDTLIRTIEDTLAEVERQFDVAMLQAKTAFEQLQLSEAEQAIQTAKILKQDSESVVQLAERIQHLPEIIDLTDKISVAKTENNHQTERALIGDLLKLTPENSALRDRKEQLEKIINDDEYQSFIQQSYRNLEAGDLGAARSALAKAQAIYPNRAEVTDVTQAIAAKVKQQRIADLWRSVETAEKNDRWVDVQTALSQLRNEAPNEQRVVEKQNQADDIVALTAGIQSLLVRPYRLSNATLSEQAENMLTRAEQWRQASPSLQQQTETLRQTLIQANTPMNVQVYSDNQTHVAVRGVGRVGVVNSKTIELKPGEYTFEGTRQGYKSVLKDVIVPLGQTGVSVTVVCDEPI